MCFVDVSPYTPNVCMSVKRTKFLDTKEILQGIINTTLMDHMQEPGQVHFLERLPIYYKSFKKDEVRMKYPSCSEPCEFFVTASFCLTS